MNGLYLDARLSILTSFEAVDNIINNIDNKDNIWKVNTEKEKYNEQIKTLKDQKEKLIETNGNLLQQISVGEEMSFSATPKKAEEKEAPSLSFRDAFDEKGNFKR